MFRTAAEIDRTVTAGSLRGAVQRWAATEDTWYDGTVASVDRRLEACKSMLTILKSASGRYRVADAGTYIAMTHHLEGSRKSLEDFKSHLLSGGAVQPLAREASVAATPEVSRFVELESQKFFASQAGTYGNDIDELVTRAANYVTAETSTWDHPMARVAQVNFVNRVEEMGRLAARQERTATISRVAHQDFDDILLLTD